MLQLQVAASGRLANGREDAFVGVDVLDVDHLDPEFAAHKATQRSVVSAPCLGTRDGEGRGERGQRSSKE